MDKQETGDELKYKCGTVEYAREELKESIASRKNVFCPLKNGTCETDCQCYVNPKIVDIGCASGHFFECKKGHCSAYMLVGPT